MNRSFASWLADNPGGAVLVTGLLGLLPLFGLGFAFFLPGAVPALVILVRGPRLGLAVAVGATVLLTLAMWMIGRPVPVGLIYSAWVLGPPLALALRARAHRIAVVCLQLAVLAGVGVAGAAARDARRPGEVLGAVRAGPRGGDAAPRPADGPREGRPRRDAGADAVGLGDGAHDAARRCARCSSRAGGRRGCCRRMPGRFGAEFQQLRLGWCWGRRARCSSARRC